VYETSAAEMSRPRQCVPLASIKYIRKRSPVMLPAVSVCHRDSLNELRHLAAASTSAVTQMNSHSSHGVLQTAAPNLPCCSSAIVASAGCSTVVSAQYPMTNCVQQSALLHTVPTAATLPRSHCQTTDVSAVISPHTVGLASAVWSPMGATLQQAPQVNATQPVCHTELLRLLAVHHRWTVAFNNQFSQQMNSVINVMHQACRVESSHVFHYTLNRLRVLRFQYRQFSSVCAAYCDYQRNVRSNLNVILPTVSCLHASIKIMMDSVEMVSAIFREMRQWLSTETRMTVTERGLVLANKLCHFAPVFMQEMSNFRRSLLMIVPNAVCPSVSQSASIASVMPSSVSSFSTSSAATVEAEPSAVTQLQESDNIELHAQDVEPVFIAPMPIVIEPDGQPDSELDLLRVKQEPVEMSRKRCRTRAELICVDDDDDTVGAAMALAAVNESDDVACTSANRQCDGDGFPVANLSSSEHHNELSVADCQLRTQLTSSQSPGTCSSGANEVLLTEALGDIANSVKECISSVTCSDTSPVRVGVSASGVIPAGRDIVPCSGITCMASQYSASEVTVDFCDEMNRGNRCSVENDSHAVTAAEHTSALSATTRPGYRTLSMNCRTSNLLNVTSAVSPLSNNCEISSKRSVDEDANSNYDESPPDKVQNAASAECHSSNAVLHAVSDMSNDLFTISSVCSVDLKRFECVDTNEGMTVDDIVSAVRTFDENANVIFDNVDLRSRYSCPQKSELSPSQRNEERVDRSKEKQQNEVLYSTVYETRVDGSVADNLQAVEDVRESNISDETLHFECDKNTVGSDTVTAVPVNSDKEHFENTVVARPGTNVEETLRNGVTDMTCRQLDASRDTGQCSESIAGIFTTLQPIIENEKIGSEENADSSSETDSETSVSVNSKAAVDTSAGNISQEATDLESGKQNCDERRAVDVPEEKQPRPAGRDDLLHAVDEDKLNVPRKKKRARVLYEDEDDENAVAPGTVSVNGRSVQCTTQTSLQANDNKKVKKFRCINSKSMGFKLKENAVLVEKQSRKKVKKREQCTRKRDQNGTVSADKVLLIEASRACTDPKHDKRKHKMKKSRKLLKRGVKPKSVSLANGSKACKFVNSHSREVTANGHVQQQSSCRLPKLHTLDVSTKAKVPSQSDNDTAAGLSYDNEVEPRLSARDKINTIFKNSEFTRLQSTTSLRHSEKKRPSLLAFASSSSEVAEAHSKIDAKSVISPRRNGKMSTVGCHYSVPKCVVTSECLSGTAVTSSAVIRRPGRQSSSVKVSAAHSDASVNTKILTNQSSMARLEQRNQHATSLSSQSKVSETLVCSNAVDHSVENTVPSVVSPKLTPCLPEVTRNVIYSVSQSVTGSQLLNISSSAALRDPRLAQRPHTVSRQMFGLKECSNAENLAVSAVVMSSCAQACSDGSVHWPWEQIDNVTPAPSTNLELEQYGRSKQSADQSQAGCWVWESGENNLSSQSSLMSVDVNDILCDLSANCPAEEYLQKASTTSEWHSATRVIHSRSLLSPPLHTSGDGHRMADLVADTTLSSDVESHKSINSRKIEDRPVVKEGLSMPALKRLSVTVEPHADRTVTLLEEDDHGVEVDCLSVMMLSDLMLPVKGHGSQQCVGDSSIVAQHFSPAGNSHVGVQSHGRAAAHAGAARWRLIPLDTFGILHIHDPSKKLLCERTKYMGPPSDPHLKASSLAVNSSSLTCNRDISVSVYRNNGSDCCPVVNWDTDLQYGTPLDPRLKSMGGSALVSSSSVRSVIQSSAVESQSAVHSWDTDSVSDAHQTQLTGELDGLQSKTSAAATLESRLDLLASVDKKVRDELDNISRRDADLDDAEKCLNNSVCSHELQQYAEDNDSDVDDFIIIDDDDDDSDDNNELVIDLSSTDVELMPQPSVTQSLVDNSPFTKTASDHTTRHDVARNVRYIVAAENKTDHSTLSDMDMRSFAKRKENWHVTNTVCRQQERRSVTNDSSVAGDQNKSVKHRSDTREHVKRGTTDARGRTVASKSNNRCSTDTSQRTVETKIAASHVLNNTAVFRRNRDYDNAEALRKMDRNPSEGRATRATRKGHKVHVSSSVTKQHVETLIDKDSGKRQCKVLKAGVDVSNVDSTSSVSVSACLASLADVSTTSLRRLKSHMESKVQAVKQKAAVCKRYACSLDNLDESEKQQLVDDGLAEPAVVSEFAVELRLVSVLREIDKTEADMAKVKSQFDPTCLSTSLEKKYDQLERACNNLIVRRDWCYTRMHRLRRYFKSKCLLTLPDDLRLSSERGKCVSVEGVPLILSDFTISLSQCKHLAALLILIKRLRGSHPTTLTQDVLQKLGWLHEERKTLLNEICCSSSEKIGHCIECLSEKLILYRYVNSTVKRLLYSILCDCLVMLLFFLHITSGDWSYHWEMAKCHPPYRIDTPQPITFWGFVDTASPLGFQTFKSQPPIFRRE